MLSKDDKDFKLWIIYLVILPCFCFGQCPKEEELAPNCWCMQFNQGASVQCKDIFDPMELLIPIEATAGLKMLGLTIMNSTLRFIPHDLFLGTKFEKIQFYNTQLISLSDGELAFEGLEDYLEEIRASATTYVSQWDFNQLRNLKKMNLIDINSIHFESFTEDLPEFPELTAFGLINAGLSHISDNALARCPKLDLLAFNSNELTTLKRSMLPNPATHLKVINLQKNKLNSLPEDFFTNMPSLMNIYLDDNQFFTLDEKVFSDMMRTVNSFTMTGNPFRCDCRLYWFVESRKPLYFEARCEQPPNLAGYRLADLETRQMHCF